MQHVLYVEIINDPFDMNTDNNVRKKEWRIQIKKSSIEFQIKQIQM